MLRRRLAVGLGALVLVTVAACSSSSDSDGGDKQASTKGTDAPISNLNWATSTPITGLDFLRGAEAVQNLLEGLVRTDGDGALVPALAESWEQPDATSYVFTIRDGVTFWDGSPLTPDDVAWSLDYARDPATGPIFSTQLAGIDSVEATGDNQVTVTLKAPDSAFLAKLTPAVIMSKAFSEKAGDTLGSPEVGVLGTGPFTVKSLDRAGSTVLVRNDDYWGDEPTVEQLTYKTIADPDTLRLALESGEVDGSFSYPLTGPESDAFTTTYAPGAQNTYLILDTTKAPFDDVHARRALSYLIDRKGIAKALFDGHASPLNSIAQPSLYTDVASGSDVKEFFDSLPELSFDVAKAKKELAQSATPDGFSLDVEVPPTVIAPLQQIMETIAQNGEPLGIDITVKPGTFATWQQSIAGKTGQLTALTAGSAYIAPFGQLDQLVSKTDAKAADGTYGQWAPPEVQALIAEGAAATPERQWEISKEILTTLSDELPFVPIVNPYRPFALSDTYVFEGGFKPHSGVFSPWAASIRSAS